MATSAITNTITDPLGAAVVGARVVARLLPTPGFKLSDNSEVAGQVETTTNGSGIWSLSLEQSGNITPDNTFYEVTEYVPEGRKVHRRVWNISVGVAAASLLDSLIEPQPSGAPIVIGSSSTVFNVKERGALGDGTTDDTDAIQALIDSVGGSSPVTIYFPPGVYLVSGLKLRSNVTLQGAGSGGYGLSTNYSTRCSVLKLKANSSLPVLGDFSTSVFVYSVLIRDLQIDGNKANQSVARHGVQLYDDVSGTDPLWAIRDCLFINCKGDGVKVGAFRRGVHIINCQAYGCDQNGITLGSTDNMVSGTIIGSCGNYGMSITAGTQHIFSCDIFSNLRGINIASGVAGVLVANCGIDRNSRQAIYCVGARNVFAGNIFASNSQETDGGFSTIDLDFPNTVALGNVVSSNTFISDGSLTNKPEYSVLSNVNYLAVGNTFGSPAPHTTGAFNSAAQAVFLERSQGITDGADIALGTTTGTKIGTATTQKLGFYNKTPVAQQTGVAVTAAGIHAALVALGLITA